MNQYFLLMIIFFSVLSLYSGDKTHGGDVVVCQKTLGDKNQFVGIFPLDYLYARTVEMYPPVVLENMSRKDFLAKINTLAIKHFEALEAEKAFVFDFNNEIEFNILFTNNPDKPKAINSIKFSLRSPFNTNTRSNQKCTDEYSIDLSNVLIAFPLFQIYQAGAPTIVSDISTIFDSVTIQSSNFN